MYAEKITSFKLLQTAKRNGSRQRRHVSFFFVREFKASDPHCDMYWFVSQVTDLVFDQDILPRTNVQLDIIDQC